LAKNKPKNLMETRIIETERLNLHAVSPAVLHHLFTTKGRDELKVHFGVGDDDLAYYQTMHDKGMETFRITQCFFLVVNKSNGITMGEIGFHTINNKHKRAELFYLLRDDNFKNQGFMSEAIKPVLTFGFTDLGLYRVEAKVGASNTPSIRLLLKNGFTLESTHRKDYFHKGIYHDSDCYVLLQPEWQNLNND
jgi:ribosomal-protein-alanine N-acetyltransferase